MMNKVPLLSLSCLLVAIKSLFFSSAHPPHPLFIISLLLLLLLLQADSRERKMGNCQAIDAATLVIQHPSGKVENFYWPVSANEIMKMNPGHYVVLVISTTISTSKDNLDLPKPTQNSTSSVRFTRIKLLRPTDALVLGQVYRLVPSQEVMKCLWEKKQAKMKKNQSESAEKQGYRSDQEHNQVSKQEKTRPRTAKATSKTWQPSLHSISEAAN